jgi:hypothetical protein
MAQKERAFGEESKRVAVAPMIVHGSLDIADCDTIAGWAGDARDHVDPLRVALFADGVQFALVTANIFRADLAEAREGKGRNGFSLATPSFLRNGKPHSIRAIIVPSGNVELAGGPRSIDCVAPTKRRGE